MEVAVVRNTAAVVCLLLLAASVARSTPTDTSVTINFERFPGPDGMLGTADDTFPACDLNGICELLGSQFADMGITFTSGLLEQSGLFPGSSSLNHFVSSSPPDATFSVPVTGISITSYSVWTATLYALDEANNVIASSTLTNPNAGSSFFLGTLTVSTSLPIRRFTVLPAGCQIGESGCGPILNLDDLVLVSISGDGDADGVADDQDQCPNTSQGAIVNVQGCSIEQLEPCAGPLSGGAWKNHGQYVSAVAGTAEAFLASGLITEEEKDALVSAAAKSSCGKG